MVVSEYGVAEVTQPIHINRILREQGFITVREELGLELLDAGASAAFAVSDHQVAHVYVNDAGKVNKVREVLGQIPGVESILDQAGKEAYRLNHPRSGDFVMVSKPDAWFTYYYWLAEIQKRLSRASNRLHTRAVLYRCRYSATSTSIELCSGLLLTTPKYPSSEKGGLL